MHTATTASTWRVMLNEPAKGSWNMAVDETLMEHVRSSGESVLRVYGWNTPTLSFGRNQSARGKYDLQRLQAAGIDCVRRPTGGRAVLHFREVTYAVVALESGLGSLRDSYERINRVLLGALARLGVAATSWNGSVESGRLVSEVAHGTSPCFDHPSRGELVLEGRKLVGSAQWRNKDVLLQHGSILTRDDQTRIVEFLVESGHGKSLPATLAEALGREPAVSEVSEALVGSLRAMESADAVPLTIQDLPSDELRLAHERFLADTWTWRR